MTSKKRTAPKKVTAKTLKNLTIEVLPEDLKELNLWKLRLNEASATLKKSDNHAIIFIEVSKRIAAIEKEEADLASGKVVMTVLREVPKSESIEEHKNWTKENKEKQEKWAKGAAKKASKQTSIDEMEKATISELKKIEKATKENTDTTIPQNDSAMKTKKEKKEAKKAKKATAKTSTKATAKTSEKKEKRPTATSLIVDVLTPLIEKKAYTRKRLVEIACEEMGLELNKVTVQTVLSDGKNPKYNKFAKLVVMNEKTKTLSFAKKSKK